MDAMDMDDIDLSHSTPSGEDDDAISYGDATVVRSHVSKKTTLTDRTGATALMDLQLFTRPMEVLRGNLYTESPVAGQLPNVEEYKVQSAYTGGTRKKRPSSLGEFLSEYGEAVFMGLMVILILIGSILVASVWAKSNAGDDGVASSSTSPDGGNLAGDTFNPPLDEDRFADLVDFISGEGWTSRFNLMDAGSPQMRAAVWISDFDEHRVPIGNTADLRERYALAVLHFATNGRDWARDVGFLSSADVCDWAIDGVKNKEEEAIRLGVDCTCRHPEAQECDSKPTNTVKRLLLPSMNLEGTIPHEIYLLYDLIEMDMNSNKIRGELSQGILLLRSLRTLSLQFNRLEGNIPSWIGDMIELREINFASNTMSGDIPHEISRLENLVLLNLNDNKLTGGLEPLQELTNLQALFLGDNDMKTRLIPQYLNKWPNLRILDLSDNSILNPLPENIFQHPTLRVLDLHGNGINGIIPEVPLGCPLDFLALQDNRLEGSIPGTIGNLTSLYHLDLSNNQLTGEIPKSGGLEYLKRLKYLFLAFNDFTEGPIPHYLPGMTDLRDLSFQKTKRTGRVPLNLGLLTNLALLDLGDNKLTGEIPTSLGDLSDLTFLILYRNDLTGAIPTELHQLDHLQKLVVHDNSITERADYMCTPPQPALKDFVMECDKDPSSNYPYCPCCKCCIDEDVNCNTLVWFGSLDPAWDTQYVRNHYKFHENDIPYNLVP
uniref:L domain-like protein n=1 Tax=Amphora coffeiformis TaxID=265554 RepID=A0A7S3L758_9STRA